MHKTWVLVADAGAARIFAAPTPTGALQEINGFANPEGRLPARELTSDLPGRAYDSAGTGRHAMENQVGPRKQAAIEFARLLAAHLAQARARGELQRLIVCAPPEFLGLLRQALDDGTRRLVADEHALDLVKMTPEEIRSRPPDKLYSTLAAR